MNTAYIGLGANLGDPLKQLHAALAALSDAAGVTLLAQSPFYRSAPIGLPGQPDYCNAVCAVTTGLPPRELFQLLLTTERAAGRVRDGSRWGPRLLDLDLLAYGDQMLDTPDLKLPHPEIARRNFVLVPLADIAPDLRIPGLGRAHDLAQAIGRAGLAPWSAPDLPL